MSGTKRPLQAEDLYKLKLVSDPQLSPDGQFALFSLQRVDEKNEKKYSDLWVVDVNSGELHQFTYGDYSDTYGRWSPDGRRIAFLSNRKDEKQMQLYIMPFRGGEARCVTDLKGSFNGLAWSPDSTQIVTQFRKKDEADIEREKDETKKKLGVVARHITSLNYKFDGAGYLPQEMWHIWIIAAETGDSTQLTDGEFHESDPIWSPNGKHILFTSNRHPERDLNPELIDLYLIPSAGGEMVKVDTRDGRKSLPSFSPDGSTIAYLGTPKIGHWYQNTSLYLVPSQGGEAINISGQSDLDISASTLGDTGSGTPFPRPVWSNDGERIFTIVGDKGNQPVVAFQVDGSGYKQIIGEGGSVDGFSLNDDQTKMVYLWGTIGSTASLKLFDLTTKTKKSLTQFNAPLLSEIEWGAFEEVWFDGPDGNRLHGWILKPPGFDASQTYPSILEIHGGPFAQYGRAFMHEFHFLASNGYVVYFSNPRGSQGYGQEHAGAIANRWGTVDYADLMAWADYMEKQPYIDKARMGVTGGSYGGYMTSLIIGKTNRFKAAVAQRVVSNLTSFYGSSDMNWGTENLVSIPGQPWNALEEYWKQSPIAYIGNAKTPTMIIHSEKDYRCDREQGEQVFVALRRMGVDSEMILFPDESHGLSRGGRTDRRIQRLQHMLRWFDTYLKEM